MAFNSRIIRTGAFGGSRKLAISFADFQSTDKSTYNQYMEEVLKGAIQRNAINFKNHLRVPKNCNLIQEAVLNPRPRYKWFGELKHFLVPPQRAHTRVQSSRPVTSVRYTQTTPNVNWFPRISEVQSEPLPEMRCVGRRERAYCSAHFVPFPAKVPYTFPRPRRLLK